MPLSQVRNLAFRIIVQETTPVEQHGCYGSLCTSESELPNRIEGKSESAAKVNSLRIQMTGL